MDELLLVVAAGVGERTGIRPAIVAAAVLVGGETRAAVRGARELATAAYFAADDLHCRAARRSVASGWRLSNSTDREPAPSSYRVPSGKKPTQKI